MTPDEVKEAFSEYAVRAIGGLPKTPRDALRAMVGFYGDVRADGCLGFDQMGDALLVEWSAPRSQVRPSGATGPYYAFGISRQLNAVSPSTDAQGDLYRLNLRFAFFPLQGEIASLEAKMTPEQKAKRWCRSPAELPGFEAFVTADRAFQVLADRPSDEPLWFEYSKV